MEPDIDIQLDYPIIRDRLFNNGLEDLCRVLLEDSVFTKGGRINKSKLAKRLQVKPAELKRQLELAREVLAEYGGSI
jgi:hypothetical protein